MLDSTGKTDRVITAHQSFVTSVNMTLMNVLRIASVNVTTTTNLMKKPFDRELYEADDNAKYKIIEWLYNNGFIAWVNPDVYGIDVLASRNGEQYGFEVEVKHNWQEKKFPFRTVHFSARKQKFIGWNHFFTMLNDDRTCVLVVDEQALRSAQIVNKQTKYTSDELFIAIPTHQCVVFLLD